MSTRTIRDSTMDALKGAAILLVVLGHSLQGLPNFDDNVIFRTIYAFHMPLFMFVSGYVAFYGGKNASWAQLMKKVSILVLPFVAWFAMSYVINGTYLTDGLPHFIKLALLSPDRGLWFLWVLFLNFVLLAGALRLEKWFQAGAIPLMWLALQWLPVDILGLSLVKWHFAFFALGFLVHRHARLWTAYRRQIALVALVAFPLLVQFWHRASGPDFAWGFLNYANAHNLRWLYEGVMYAYTYAVPILGIVAVWSVVSWLALYAPNFYKLFGWLGLYTMDIYVTHQLLLRFGFGEGGVKVVTAFIIGLVGSLAISFLLLRRNSTVAHIFLGKPYPKPRVVETGAKPRGSTVSQLSPSRPVS